MAEIPARANIRPRDLEWLAHALKLSEEFSPTPALESLLDNLPTLILETWPARKDVVQEGAPGEDFFVVYKGEMSVWRRAGKAAAREVGKLQPGDFFGEIGFLMKSSRSATVRTESACRIFRFSARDFHKVLERYKLLDLWVKRVACERIAKIFQENGH